LDTLTLDGRSLRLEQLQPLLEGKPLELILGDEARRLVERARSLVEEHVRAGNVVYGLTTGFGKLKDVAIDAADLERLQRNLILSHCCGCGDPMPVAEVRIAQVLRLNGLSRGHSGVRLELLETLIRLFEKGFVPEVPQKGSVGASGDLAPLAHMAAAYMGAGHALLGGKRMSAADALVEVGEAPIILQAKEGLALINGTEIMKATGVVAWLGAANLSKAADAICALTIEAMHGSLAPFDDRLATLKGSAGHRRTAANVRRCLEGSAVLESHADCDRVQDAYSLRCAPQVHGASKAAIEHVGDVLAAEINSVTDNPVLFPESGEVISAGQFHGQPVSMALDYLAIGVTTLANISERRIEQLVNPDLSGLPAFLTPNPGVNSGYMIAQVAAAALASENKVLVHPASADTVPTNANQEDHVSMGVTAARKAREIVENTESVLAIELLCAAQARDLRDDLRAGPGAEALYELVRSVIPKLEEDRYLHDDLLLARELVRGGDAVAAVEAAIGPLDA
jgi:histidine ammonia-lyase